MRTNLAREPAQRPVGPGSAFPASIGGWIEAQVARTPDAVAVAFEGENLSFRELNSRANQLARHLRRMGVGPEAVVGLSLERSLNFVVGLLATLKAGGAYLPLDPGHARQRLDHILEDAHPIVLLTQSALAAEALPRNVSLFQMDSDWPGVAGESVENLDLEIDPAQAAYVIFTSGSTGRPKGVVVEHRQLASYLAAIIPTLELPAGLRYAIVSTFAADLGHTVLFPSLVTGGQLHVIAEARAADPKRLADYLQREGIEVLKIVPSHLRALLRSAPPGVAAHCLPSRCLVLGGEAADWSLIETVRELAPACRIFNHYGPTETTVGVLVNDLQQAAPALRPDTVPLGRTLSNARVWIVDPQLRVLAAGETGELLIGGECVARGYLNRPELTAERFIADPESIDPAARRYRTGDLVRELADGNIEFLGRLDHQVKIRGYRVELGEIEAVLGGHPDLSSCAVVAQGKGGEEKVLTAFLVCRPSGNLSVGALRRWLEQKLPDHMVPTRFFVLPALPLTANGKLDRRALEAFEGVELPAGTSHTAARTVLERHLVEIWQAVLGRERLGIEDNFFDLGGHSLLALAIGAQIAHRLDVEVPIRWVLENPTVEKLARQVESRKGVSAPGLPIARISRQQPMPASPAQQRMWLLQQTVPDSATYNQPKAFRWSGRVDRDRVRRALQRIVERHEILRTALVQDGEILVQQILPADEIPLPWGDVDLRDAPPGERSAALDERLLAEARQPFDLAEVPVWRALWIELADDEQVLAFVFHHSIEDERTWRLFVRELEQLYAADAKPERASLPELPVQYADFAVWQRQRLAGPLLAPQRAYWAEQLREPPAALELPAELARPAHRSGHGAVHDFQITGPVVARLRELAREEGTTLFAVWMAAFQIWLHRCTGQTDLIVGTPITNRERPEIQSSLGFFLNTLPIRGRLEGSLTFREVLRQVRASLLGALSHADLPFEEMVAMAVRERAAGLQPLYQVMLVFLEESPPVCRFGEVEGQPLPLTTGTSKNDLTLSVEAVGMTCACQFEYATDLFTADAVSRMGCHLTELLGSIVSEPEKQIRALALMSAAERHQTLVEWNATRREYPRDQCVHELFEAEAARAPQAVALVFEGRAVTYRELDAQANRVAHVLRARGVGPDVLVGLCLERSPELIVGLLGILKAGGAYLPLDPSYPAERLAFMVSDAALDLIVTQRSLVPMLPAGEAQCVCLDADGENMSREPADKPVSGVTAENLAYVIFTSGSTGRPKGVLVPHRGLGNVAAAQAHAFQPGPGDRVLAFASISFDASIFEIVMALTHGASLCLGRPENLMPGPELVRFLSDHAVSIVTLTPSALAVLPMAALPALRVVAVAGEACSAELVARWAPGRRFFNLYGPTETTIWATLAECQAGGGPPPIGRPIANMQAYVLDRHLSPVPVGVVGELFLAGAGVARGYLGRPELTAERFIANPFTDAPDARLYRTGDLVRYRPDGNLEFLGRADQQVKIRGFRVELGEIESVLRQHGAVREAVVVAREESPGDVRLAAYCVPSENHAPTAAELSAFLQRKLPGYLVPATFTILAALPLTPSGKIDRQALPAPGAPGGGESYVPPASTLEERVAKLWAVVLRVERVGVLDNFFALGGHSLLAGQLVSRLRDELDVEIPLRSIFENQTVRSLAADIERSIADGGGTAAALLPPVVRVPRAGPLPLSFAQERLWFLDQLQPGLALYNVAITLRLVGELDAAVVQRCLDEIVRRHESLRTRFEWAGERPVQVIAAAAAVELPCFDLSALLDPHRSAEALRRCEEEARRPFDLASDRLLRARLFRLAPTEHLLFINVHHIAMDEWSAGLLTSEFTALYQAFSAGLPSPLAEPPVQYADFAAWQREWLRGDRLERQLGYWRGRLAGAPALLELPLDFARPAIQTHRGALETALFERPLAEALQALSRAEGVSLFMLLLAAFQVLVCRLTGQEDVVVGSPTAGRSRTEIEGLIGFFVNLLVLRCDLSGDPSFRELLDRVRTVTLGAYAHQEVPFEKIVEDLQPARNLSYGPLCQVLFALQHRPADLPCGDLRVDLDWVPNGMAKFDLSLTMIETDAGLRVLARYSSDLFERATIAGFLNQFRTLLGAIVANPEARLGALPLMTSAERTRVLEEWNRTDAPYPRERCIHELFEAQVEKTPEAAALAYEGQQLTYRELDARANRVAAALRARGVGPEVLVGLCLERSLEMIVGLLGILKAGGAYVPLDPAVPKARLAFMIADTAMPVLLTQKSLLASLPPALPTVEYLEIERLPAAGAREKTDRATGSRVSSANLVYVMFTSGSTGTPKAVAIEHRQLVNYVTGIARSARFGEGWSFATVSSLSADLGNTAIFPALCSGGCVHVIAPRRILDPEAFAAYFDEHSIDCLKIVPSHFAALQSGAGPERVMPKKCLVLAGEPLSIELAERLRRLAPECAICNHYGPTETAVAVLAFTLEGEIPTGPSRTVPLGRPIANAQVYILDHHREPTPRGVPGEIYIGGSSVGRGYLGRPELTAERFVPDPFSKVPGARLYRTGDRARQLADGNFEFLGRLDAQVKIRGFRIEPAEIEAALATHPLIRRAAVAIRESAGGEPVLMAFVAARTGAELTAAALRAFLREQLPDYMIPGGFVFLPDLPLTTSGKVDRRALPSTVATDRSETGALTPPSDAKEVELVRIWEEALATGPIGVQDNFFDLGGHSLMAAKIIGELRRTLGVHVPLAMLFLHPTIQELARVLPAGPEFATGAFIRLKSGSAPRKLIFIIGEFGMPLMQLATLLESDVPMFASIGSVPKAHIDAMAAGRRRDLPGVETLATRHCDQILAQDSGESYVLAGYCIEGVFAIEVARQLRARGAVVDSVLLFDSIVPPASLGWGFAWRGYRIWLRRNFALTARYGARYFWSKIKSKFKRAGGRSVPRAAPAGEPGRAEDQATHFAHVKLVRKIYRLAHRNYRAQPLPCRGVVFLSADTAGCTRDPTLGARAVFGAGVEIVAGSGDHTTMLEEPHVRGLASKIAPRLSPLDG